MSREILFGGKRKVATAVFAMALLALSCVYLSVAPFSRPLPLPDELVSLDSTEGRKLLETAESQSDFEILDATFAAQILTTYCGVASAVMVLKASDIDARQTDFFLARSPKIRDWARVAWRGMSLYDVSQHIRRFGAETEFQHIEDLSLDEFRWRVASVLGTPGQYMIVNYNRPVIDQHGSGHMSPLGAYNAASDMVLIMDTASYKYPKTWVPLPALYAAMQDSGAGGVVVVHGKQEPPTTTTLSMRSKLRPPIVSVAGQSASRSASHSSSHLIE